MDRNFAAAGPQPLQEHLAGIYTKLGANRGLMGVSCAWMQNHRPEECDYIASFVAGTGGSNVSYKLDLWMVHKDEEMK